MRFTKQENAGLNESVPLKNDGGRRLYQKEFAPQSGDSTEVGESKSLTGNQREIARAIATILPVGKDTSELRSGGMFGGQTLSISRKQGNLYTVGIEIRGPYGQKSTQEFDINDKGKILMHSVSRDSGKIIDHNPGDKSHKELLAFLSAASATTTKDDSRAQ